MMDAIMTVSREKIRDVIGRLEDKSMVEVNRALALWVGLAWTLRSPLSFILYSPLFLLMPPS
jgi:RNase P/RNase MRP subunit POP5